MEYSKTELRAKKKKSEEVVTVAESNLKIALFQMNSVIDSSDLDLTHSSASILSSSDAHAGCPNLDLFIAFLQRVVR